MEFKRTMWSEEDEQFLIDNYGRMEDEELSRALNRSIRGIKEKIRYLMDTTDKTELVDGYRVAEISLITGIPKATVKHKLVNKEMCDYISISGVYFVEYDILWDWIKMNKEALKICNINLKDLYTAPQWYKTYVFELKEKENRYLTKLENYVKLNLNKVAWDELEVKCVVELSKLGYTSKKLSQITGRTSRAIQVKVKRECNNV